MPTARKIEAMHQHYGINPNEICRDCCNLICHDWGKGHKRYYKCLMYADSASTSSDWRVHNQACGKFDIPFDELRHIPLMDQLTHAPKEVDDKPIRGQVSML